MHIRRIFSSLNIKLFLGFWVIAITAITITRFVSIQFAEFNQGSELSKPQQKILANALQRVNSNSSKFKGNITQFIDRKNRRIPRGIWLQSRKTGEIFTNSNNRIPQVIDRLEKQAFTAPVVLQLGSYLLIGPQSILIKGEQYHLFIGKDWPRKNFAGLVQEMPFWVRVLTILIVTGGLCWLLSWYLVSPMKRLTKASHNFGAGNFSTRVPELEHREDEVGQLGQAFNSMASHLQTTITAQQRLLGDVSHELRSPLTRLHLALSLAQKVDNKPPELEKYLNRCSMEIDRLDAMIAQALQLSRLENQLQKMVTQRLDLTALVHQVIDAAELLLNTKSLQVKADLTSPIFINGDHQLLNSAFENLLNNAIRYSPENGQIDIQLSHDDNVIHFKIQDQGKGVDPAQLEKIFQPFYRTAEARDRVSGGTGLGLAITSKAIESHKGRIYAKAAHPNANNQGLQVNIELPYAYD